MTAGRKGLQLWAKCWRNKCPFWGHWDVTDVGGLVRPTDGPQQAPKRYVVDTLPLTQDLAEGLCVRYRLRADTLVRFGIRQGEAGRAVYAPVYGPGGALRGLVRRWLDGTRPKVKGYPGHDQPEGAPWQAWYRPTALAYKPTVLVAVEDVFSAMRLAEVGVTAVALLGTALSTVKVAELRNERRQIVVALDADAYCNALGFGVKYTLEVRRLEPDIKDMTEEQLTIWTTSLYSSLPALVPATPVRS